LHATRELLPPRLGRTTEECRPSEAKETMEDTAAAIPGALHGALTGQLQQKQIQEAATAGYAILISPLTSGPYNLTAPFFFALYH